MKYLNRKEFLHVDIVPSSPPVAFYVNYTDIPHTFCQTPDLGQGQEFDFTFANNNKNNENNPHLNFPGWDGTRGLKFGTQT